MVIWVLGSRVRESGLAFDVIPDGTEEPCDGFKKEYILPLFSVRGSKATSKAGTARIGVRELTTRD